MPSKYFSVEEKRPPLISRGSALATLVGGVITLTSCSKTAAPIATPEIAPQVSRLFGNWKRGTRQLSNELVGFALVFPTTIFGKPAINKVHLYAHLGVIPAILQGPPQCPGSESIPMSARRGTGFASVVDLTPGINESSVILSRAAGIFELQDFQVATRGIALFTPSSTYSAVAKASGESFTVDDQLCLAYQDVNVSYAIAVRRVVPGIDAPTIAAAKVMAGLTEDELAMHRRAGILRVDDFRRLIASRMKSRGELRAT